MNTIGFPISSKKNEKRRALIPQHIAGLKHPEMLFFEKGYGEVIGFSDEDYINAGANVVSREEVLSKDIVCDPKIGDADYLGSLKNQTVFGWLHAVRNRDIADKLIDNGLTGIAWEDMYSDNRHTFWRNNEIAGEAAVMHAFQCYGEMPYNTKVALIGKGNVGCGALKILTLLGADVTIYDRKTEALFKKELPLYDVVVNALLWDSSRTDHIIWREDLKRMKKGALIIDISCDRHGAIETSEQTSIDSPTYTVDGICHYVVDHTPTLFYKTATSGISEQVCKFIDELVDGSYGEIIKKAVCIEKGEIKDHRINEFQNR